MNPASYPPLIPYSTGSSSSSSSSSSYDRTANAHENSRRVKKGRVRMKPSLASPANFSVLVPTITSYLTWKDHLRFALTSHSWKHALLPVPSKLDDGSVNLCSLSNIVCKISYLNLTVLAAYFKMSKISASDIDRCNISLLFKRCISLSRLDISPPSHPPLDDLERSLAHAISRQFFPICQALRPSTLIDLEWMPETNMRSIMRSIKENIDAHEDKNVLERVDRACVIEEIAPLSLTLDYLSSFPRLHHLEFWSEQPDLTEPFRQLASACPFLTSLNLTTPYIEGNVLGPYMEMIKLSSLELNSNALKDTCLVSLSKNVEKLESFEFLCFNEISTTGIQMFLSQCKNLQRLTLEDEYREDDDPTLNWDQILQTAASCPKLEFVQLIGNDNVEKPSLISFESLNSLKKNCPNLKELHLHGMILSEKNLEASTEILSQLENITLTIGKTFTIRDAHTFLRKYINDSKQKPITFNFLSKYNNAGRSYNFGDLSTQEEQGAFYELVTLLCHPCLRTGEGTCHILLTYLIENVIKSCYSSARSFIGNSINSTSSFEDNFTYFKNTHGDLIAHAYSMLINQYKHLRGFNSVS